MEKMEVSGALIRQAEHDADECKTEKRGDENSWVSHIAEHDRQIIKSLNATSLRQGRISVWPMK